MNESLITANLRPRPQIDPEVGLEARDGAEGWQDLAGQDALDALATDSQLGVRAERVDAHAAGANALAQPLGEDLRVTSADGSILDQRGERPVNAIAGVDVLARGALTLGSGHELQPTGHTTQTDLPYSHLVLQDHYRHAMQPGEVNTVAYVIENYTPGARVCDPQIWPLIADDVRAAVHSLELDKRDTVNHFLADVTRYLAWCHVQGHPKEFREDLIAAFCDTLTFVATSVQRHRTRLRRIGVGYGTVEKLARTQFPHHTHTGGEPYTRAELDRWWEVASSQKTAHRSRLLRATVALGAGAGVTTAEMANLRTRDFSAHPAYPDLLLVHLPDRVVPVDAAWVERVRQIVDDAPSEYLFGTYHTQTKDLLAYVKSKAIIPDDVPALTIRRLRTTYAVSLLTRRVSVSEFMAIFGNSTAISFERLARFVPARWDDAEYLRVAAGIA